MVLPDLEQRLAALEPLRQQTALLSKGLHLARLWVTRMGPAVTASVALSVLAVWQGVRDGGDPPAWVFVAVAVGLFGPLAIGLALVVPPTVRSLRGRAQSDLAYAERLRADVLEPLARAAVPGATIDFTGAFDVTQFDASGISRTSVADWERHSPMRVAGALDGMAWTAAPVRIWRTQSQESETGSGVKTEVLHDGLFAWTASPNRLPHTVLVADQASGEQSRMRSSPLSAQFGRLPDAPVAGDLAFDERFVVLTGDPDALRSLTLDVRRAMLAVFDAVGAPLRIAVSPQGVCLAFPDRGRFRGPDVSAQPDEGAVTPGRLLRDMTAAFDADAALLSRVPAALQTLRCALPA